ncbi:MAG TPA: M20/M25/M40 family metallo-hydrolase [Aggregatilineaceae bacterium]|nr:M20/M25/M40 family metallo-hydrolase [Aggregatilineaceae bacterium]
MPKALCAAAEYLPTNRREVLFVSADRVMRGTASDHGYFAVPHPVIAALLVRDYPLQFVRITGAREQFDYVSGMVPYFCERNADGSWILLALVTDLAMAEFLGRRVRVDVLALDISIEDLLFVQLDCINEQTAEELKRHKVLYYDGQRILLTLGPSESNEQLNLPHGHFQFLQPNPDLLSTAPDADMMQRNAKLHISRWPKTLMDGRINSEPGDLLPYLCTVTAPSLQANVERYSGVTPLDGEGVIMSRHEAHPDNIRVVNALVNDLNAMGYCAYKHSFTFGGKILHNVMADLPGQGYFKISSELLEKIRAILIRHPWPDPPDRWFKPLQEVLGEGFMQSGEFGDISPAELRIQIERLFELKPWFPWWLCPQPGPGAQLVIVGCHLDSTTASDEGYNPAVDPGPGADDDASGIAATLAIARYLAQFRGQLTHTVRFSFFNAEEAGMIGSNAYAAMLKAIGAPVKAVICTDMIGYNSDRQRIFQIHAGYTNPTIRDASVPLADIIASWAACMGKLSPAHIYKGTSSSGGSDRHLYDGAINRSDHASFQQQGYSAVVVSEDFLSKPGANPNPNCRHNTVMDFAYAADITCAIAFAVKELAS